MQPSKKNIVFYYRMNRGNTTIDSDRGTLLVRDCINGKPGAHYRLYKLYAKAMFNLAYRITNNREDAEDILQEVFTECFSRLGSFRFESTFGAWLRSITVNRSINHIRKKRLILVFPEEIPEVIEEEDDSMDYDIGSVYRGIESLPDGYRIILSLYLIEGYDHSEISEIMGISESTSKSQYSRAKAKLRELLKNKR